jgi:hypothetical protein
VKIRLDESRTKRSRQAKTPPHLHISQCFFSSRLAYAHCLHLVKNGFLNKAISLNFYTCCNVYIDLMIILNNIYIIVFQRHNLQRVRMSCKLYICLSYGNLPEIEKNKLFVILDSSHIEDSSLGVGLSSHIAG